MSGSTLTKRVYSTDQEGNLETLVGLLETCLHAIGPNRMPLIYHEGSGNLWGAIDNFKQVVMQKGDTAAVAKALDGLCQHAKQFQELLIEYKISLNLGGDVADKGTGDLTTFRFLTEFIGKGNYTIVPGNRDYNKLRLLTLESPAYIVKQLLAELKLERAVGVEQFAGLKAEARAKKIEELVGSGVLTAEDAQYLSWVDGGKSSNMLTYLRNLTQKNPEITSLLEAAVSQGLKGEEQLVTMLKSNTKKSTQVALLQWMLSNTMGAPTAFENRRKEITGGGGQIGIVNQEELLERAERTGALGRYLEKLQKDGIFNDESSIEKVGERKELTRFFDQEHWDALRAETPIDDLAVYQNFQASVAKDGFYSDILTRGDVIQFQGNMIVTHGQFRIENMVRMAQALNLIKEKDLPRLPTPTLEVLGNFIKSQNRAYWDALFTNMNKLYQGVMKHYLAHVHAGKPPHTFKDFKTVCMILQLAEPSKGEATVVQANAYHTAAHTELTTLFLAQNGWTAGTTSGHQPVTGGDGPRVVTGLATDQQGNPSIVFTHLNDSSNGRVPGSLSSCGYAQIDVIDTNGNVVGSNQYAIGRPNIIGPLRENQREIETRLVHACPVYHKESQNYSFAATNLQEQKEIVKMVSERYGIALDLRFNFENGVATVSAAHLHASPGILVGQVVTLKLDQLNDDHRAALKLPDIKGQDAKGQEIVKPQTAANDTLSIQNIHCDSRGNWTVNLIKTYGLAQNYKTVTCTVPLSAIDPTSLPASLFQNVLAPFQPKPEPSSSIVARSLSIGEAAATTTARKRTDPAPAPAPAA